MHAFKRAFRNSECLLTTAATAAEGLNCIRESKPNVVVLDVHLPDASGLDLFQTIRDFDARIPVIMMTAEQNPRLSSESFSAGAVAFLPKPFTTSQLQTMLRMFVQNG